MNETIETLYKKIDAQDKIINTQVLEIAKLKEDCKELHDGWQREIYDKDKILLELALETTKKEKAIEYLKRKQEEPEWWDTDFMICINILEGGNGTLKEILGDDKE